MEERTTRAVGLAILGLSIVVSAIILAPLARRVAPEVRMISRQRTATERGLRGRYSSTSQGAVEVVEFVDFECPGCRAFYWVLEELERKHSPDVRVSYRHFPLSIHPHAVRAAVAVECAARQGAFGEFQRLAFEYQDSVRSQAWSWLANRATVSDAALFSRCLESTDARAIVDYDAELGHRLGLDAAPTTFIGDSVIIGSRSLEQLERILASTRR